MASNSNRKTGTSFEHELCIALSEQGFWAHNLAQNSAGQPFDVIAARNGRSYPIDCKVCENDTFPMRRMEENQISSMTLWQETGNGEGWFALKLSDGQVYMLTFSFLAKVSLTCSTLNREQIVWYGLTLERWIELCV